MRKPLELAARREFKEQLEQSVEREQIMAHIGISLSGYYKWKSRLAEYGDRWVQGKPILKWKRHAGKSAPETVQIVVGAAFRNPTRGPKWLSSHLWSKLRFDIAPSTVHSILCKRKLNTTELRLKRIALYEKEQSNPEVTKKIRTLFGKQLNKRLNDTRISWAGERGQKQGQVLVQGVFRTPWQWPMGACKLHVVVDTFSEDFYAFIAETDDGNAPAICLEGALRMFSNGEEGNVKVYYDKPNKLYEKSQYKKLLRNKGVVSEPYKVNANGTNPMVYGVIPALKEFIRNEAAKNPDAYRDDVDLLNPLIRDFLKNEFGYEIPSVV